MTKFKNLFLLFTYFLLTCELQAQIIEFPLPVTHGHQFRIKNDSIPIDLPLWDDFSNSDRFTDTTFWVSNTAIFINPGISYQITPDLSFQANAAIPVYRNVGGTQVAPTYRFNTGVFYRFSTKKKSPI